MIARQLKVRARGRRIGCEVRLLDDNRTYSVTYDCCDATDYLTDHEWLRLEADAIAEFNRQLAAEGEVGRRHPEAA